MNSFDEIFEDNGDFIDPIYVSNSIGADVEHFIEYLKINKARFIGDKFHFEDIHSLTIKFIEEGDHIMDITPLFKNLTIAGSDRQPISIQKTYLMLDENTGYYKIGKSINPQFREGTLQSKKPTIILICICEADIEKDLHDLFEIKRMRGEWFNLSEKDVVYIKKEFKKHNTKKLPS